MTTTLYWHKAPRSPPFYFYMDGYISPPRFSRAFWWVVVGCFANVANVAAVEVAAAAVVAAVAGV